MISAGTDYRARDHAYMFLHVLFAPSTYDGLVKKK